MWGIRLLLVICPLAGCGRFSFDEMPDGDDAPPVARVTIELSGTGAGMVVGTGGITCTETCTVEVTPGTAVSLRGLATTGSWLAGWSGPCGGNFTCDVIVDDDVTIDAEFTPRPNRVFISSTDVAANMGGVASADATCASLATDAGLDGTFVAYLSDATVNAVDRIASSRGWIRTDGAPVADVAFDFEIGPLIFPIRLDQGGNDVGRVPVFTGSQGGTASGFDCAGWTSSDPLVTGGYSFTSWGTIFATYGWTEPCDVAHRLTCIEIGRNIPVAARPDTGRLAFITVDDWVPGGGRSDADALCAREADDAGLTGSFLAALATTSQSIAERFTAGVPYRRVDGVRLVRDGTLFTTDYLDVAPEVDLAGLLREDDYWTGANRLDDRADPSTNCSDWASRSDVENGHMGFTSETDVTRSVKLDLCNSAVPLLCLEQ